MAYVETPGDASVAESSDSRVLEPSADVHTLGWAVSEQPPSQWFNALFKRLYRWTQLLFAGTVGGLQWTNSPYCEAPKVAANAGGTTGNWVISIPLIRSVTLTGITFRDLAAIQLDATHVAVADRMLVSGNAALYADSFYFVYITTTGVTPTYVINRTAPVTGTPFDASGRRYLCHFRTDNQGTFTGTFPSATGVPIPFSKTGKTITYNFDRSTSVALYASALIAVGSPSAAVDLSLQVPSGAQRATLYVRMATSAGGGSTILEVTNENTVSLNGRTFQIEGAGAEFTAMCVYTATMPDPYVYLRLSGGTADVYVVGYDDPYDC